MYLYSLFIDITSCLVASSYMSSLLVGPSPVAWRN